MDDNNKKRLQNIVGKFLYYAKKVDPTMLVGMNSLEAVQTKPTIKSSKQVTDFLNYGATNPDAVTEYRRSGIIIHIYLDTSHISEPEARIRAGGYFFLGPKSNTPMQ